MIVHVEGAMFERSAGDSFELLDVVHLCALGRHALVLDPGAAKQAERWCDLFGGAMADALRDELRLARRRGLETERRGRVRAEICLSTEESDNWTSDPPRLTLRTAWHYLHQPLRVMVENTRSDGAFIQKMLFGDEGEDLRKAFRDGRITCAHGGGLGELRKFVEATRDDRGARMRLVLVFDHDGFTPSEPAKPSRDLRDLCDAEKVHRHPLERRSIENYIPLKALRRRVDRLPQELRDAFEQRVEALSALAKVRPDIHNHYNMKDGLCGDMRESLPAPFNAIPDELLAPLASGFGDKIASLVYNDTQIPIRESWIRDDGSAGEIQRLMNLLIERM